MSDKICIFAGTTEGRRLVSLLKDAADVTTCVATEYGGEMLCDIDGVRVRQGRMNAEEMTAFFTENRFDKIIDATHPYAEEATANIAAAAKAAGVPLMRILREKDAFVKDAVYVSSVAEAKEYLSDKDGNVLITTGSKELSAYVGLDMQRVWARVLPLASSLEACENAGVPTPHIIAMQGPFSEETNLAQLNAINAKYLVTKDSGKNGGFYEKISAARKAGAVPVIIGQPPQTKGLLPDEAAAELSGSYSFGKRDITLIGIGPGGGDTLTPEAKNALDMCDAVIGAPSVTKALNVSKPVYNEYLPEKVRGVLDSHPSIRRAAVVFRGDTGFFSGAAGMMKEFEGENVKIIPGLSSLSLFAARLGVSWDGASWLSLHGRDGNLISAVNRNKKLFVLTGGQNTPAAVCERLVKYGFGELSVAKIVLQNGYRPAFARLHRKSGCVRGRPRRYRRRRVRAR